MMLGIKCGLFTLLLFTSTMLAFSQAPQSTPAPAPQPTPPPAPAPTMRPIYLPSSAMRRMRDASNRPPDITDVIAARQSILSDYAREIYGKPTSDELKAVEPSASLLQQYAVFLSMADTGILKFAPSSECTKNKFVVSASDECRAYTMPGSGASFSFRKQNYQVRQLADMTLDRGTFVAGGVLSNAAIVILGDTPIETVSANTEAVKYLAAISPGQDVGSARSLEASLFAGITENGLTYARSAQMKAGNTYALRVIAYRGRVERAIRGIEYNELDYDKRRDVIVAFRVVDVSADGGVTIVWKLISDRAAQRLKGDREEFRSWVREYDTAASAKQPL